VETWVGAWGRDAGGSPGWGTPASDGAHVPTSGDHPSCPRSPPSKALGVGRGHSHSPWRRWGTRRGTVPSPPGYAEPGEGDPRHRKATGNQRATDGDSDEPAPPDPLPGSPTRGHLPPLSPPSHGHSPRDGDTAYLQPWGAVGGCPRLPPLSGLPNPAVG